MILLQQTEKIDALIATGALLLPCMQDNQHSGKDESAIPNPSSFTSSYNVTQGLNTRRLSLPRYWGRDSNRWEGFWVWNS